MDKFKKIVKEIYPYVIIILVVILIRLFIITPVTVDGPSMNETLHQGDVLIINKINKENPKRDQIVVFRKGNDKLIKRVIALPGEKIKCVSGTIYINNEEYNDSYGYGTTTDFMEVKLGDGQYFVLGDNRQNSADSRLFGPVSKEKIEGTALFRVFPFTKLAMF